MSRVIIEGRALSRGRERGGEVDGKDLASLESVRAKTTSCSCTNVSSVSAAAR